MQSIAACLAPLRASAWPDVAWRASRLTSDGFPVEFAFSNRDGRLRMTFEPAGPECDERQKLDRALDLLALLDEPGISADELAIWKEIQGAAPLRWGAWFGLRQAGKRVSAKVYVEIPRGIPVPQEWQHPLGAELRMLGYEPATAGTEYYYALPGATAAQLTQILRPLGRAASDAVRDALSGCSGLPLDSMLRFNGIGVSRATKSSIPLPGMTVFFRGMFKSRRRLHRLLLSSAQAAERPCSPYARWLGDAAGDDLPDHGVVSVTSRDDASVEIRAGLSGAALLSRTVAAASQVAA